MDDEVDSLADDVSDGGVDADADEEVDVSIAIAFDDCDTYLYRLF